ncbi:glycosyltransferase [Olivibacter domesticus]|uniref:Glycosyltransferase involved in cell wall bisynthesis n=1 Tax=Olivibacter domesticus TaxID=407022 RepID=A0A1H7YG04_OLID1|nr:glycosyltransferase [Olivibacter domesticus]SEM44885.1 Glycosyltransferase involved in cell wall bisynthesis [Olivibacter domesticus]
MKIVLVGNVCIPALKYGAIERIICWLGKELSKMGHEVTYLVSEGSYGHYGKIIVRDEKRTLESQIPVDADVVHFHYPINNYTDKPHIVTIHGNSSSSRPFSINSVFVSNDHATRYGATAYVYNGIDAEEYGKPNFSYKRSYFHFLGKAAWRTKNVRGAIDVAVAAKETLFVLGGTRLNIKMGFRFTFNPNVKFRGMVGGEEKNNLIARSKGMIFPVRWHEPFGIAMMESLYLGCPIFGTPYGALPELIVPEVGHLSSSCSALADAVREVETFNRKSCYEYVCDNFLSKKMALDYLEKYKQVIEGQALNKAIPVLQEINTPKFLPWTN